MISLRAIATAFIVLDWVAILVFFVSSGMLKGQEEAYLQETIESKTFTNPSLALKVVRLLAPYIEVPLKHYNSYNIIGTDYGKIYLGIKIDPDYCDKVLQNFVEEPSIYFNELNFLTDDLPDALMRSKLIPTVGRDLNPNTTYAVIPKKNSSTPRWFLDPKITMYYINRELHYHHRYGKEIACLYQEFSYIPGIATLFRKDYVASSATNYTYKYADKPQCFDGNKFFPRTLALDNKTECEKWFNYINSDAYKEEKRQKTIVFIRKISVGSHQGKGVQVVDEEEEKNLTETYQNGKLCGKIKKPVIVQRYVANPLLLMDHKFDFRIYMLIASTNPLVVFYHDGFLRVSLFEYDVNNKEKAMHLTNTAQSVKAMKKLANSMNSTMNEQELLDFQMWNLTRFTDYLVSIGKVESRDWLDEYLRPQFQHAMQHLVRMTQHMLYPGSQSYQLMGVDFMLDDDLNLWFIEANVGPELKGSPKQKEMLVSRMVYDLFEITTSFLKSRLKRIVKYVNWLENSGQIQIDEEGNVTIKKLEQRRKEFADITKNYFDEEFELSSDNTWVKIVDENIEGLARYNGMFDIECF